MEFKKKIRCPYCDGKIRYEKETEWLDSNPYRERNILIPKVARPFCASCGKQFNIAIKTEGELEIILEECS